MLAKKGPGSEGREGGRAEAGTHHDAGEEAHAFPTVCVGHHVPITNGKECDGDEPHGTQEVTSYVLLVMVPAKGKTGVSRRNCHCREHRPRASPRGEGGETVGWGGSGGDGDTEISLGDCRCRDAARPGPACGSRSPSPTGLSQR